MGKKVTTAINKLKGKNWMIITMNMLALVAVVQNVNAACLWLTHQPKVPESANRFKKI